MHISALTDLHAGESVHIVGKGPSLQHLTASDFGPGPVIALNSAILAVEPLNLPNRLYSMQKDGCAQGPLICDDCPGYRRFMAPVRPGAAYISQVGFSDRCLPHLTPRYEFTADSDATRYSTMSIVVATYVAHLMGAREVVYIACDSFFGEYEVYDPTGYETGCASAGSYEMACRKVLEALADYGLPHRSVTPSA